MKSVLGSTSPMNQGIAKQLQNIRTLGRWKQAQGSHDHCTKLSEGLVGKRAMNYEGLPENT